MSHVSPSDGDFGRRRARSAQCSASASVSMNMLPNARWATSAARGARTASVYVVMSSSCAVEPWFVSVMRLTSAGRSGDTVISVVVSMSPSRRWISTRSMAKATS
jgi:hypothetical protein